MILKTKGFTLIDTIITITIGLLLFLTVISVYLVQQRAYKAETAKLELSQNSRVIFDRLTRELRQSVKLVTSLPPTKDDPNNPPPAEIVFEDGHQTSSVQYLKYYLRGTDLYHQVKVYYFSSDPTIYVHFDDHDQNDQPPTEQILEDKKIGEYLANLQFYGQALVNIEATFNKNNYQLRSSTSILGRNL